MTVHKGLEALGTTQAAVLRLLRRCGMASRVELAEQCGITPAAMSMITRQLVEAGIIHEGERRRGGRGAPQIELSLNGNVGHVLGVHATLHEISMALLDFKGCLLSETRCSGNFANFADVSSTIERLSNALRINSGEKERPLIGAGIAIPTRFHNKASGLDLAHEVVSWEGTDLTENLQEIIGCTVHIENDANAAALGELSLGNSSGYGDFTYLYLSEGIGSGLVLNGSLYRGHLGNAGEAGALHPRGGTRPSFEDLAEFFQQKGIPVPERGSRDWDDFLKIHQDIADEWLERAVSQVQHIADVFTSIIAPAAIFIGGTLPVMLRQMIVERLNFPLPTSTNPRLAYKADFVMPDIKAQDAVAFGAAASILHRL